MIWIFLGKHNVVFFITWHSFQRACGLLHVHLRSQPWYVEESCLLPSFNHGTNVILSFKAFNQRLILSIVIFGMTSQTHYYYIIIIIITISSHAVTFGMTSQTHYYYTKVMTDLFYELPEVGHGQHHHHYH